MAKLGKVFQGSDNETRNGQGPVEEEPVEEVTVEEVTVEEVTVEEVTVEEELNGIEYISLNSI